MIPLSLDSPQNIEFGKYRLIRRIAVGGMAEIWLAVQRGPHGFEKTAVLKVILPDLCTNDDFVQMFLDEARLAAGLDHTNVVRIYEFGEVDGRYYLAMEHLPGEDLASIIQAHKRAKRMVPLEIACEMIIGAANGLHFAHNLMDPSGRLLNVVHRDVSPSNIIVTYHGNVKLVDFGIARAESNISKTAVGTLKGKVSYASPEQAAGEPLDRRSDVFALGAVLYELLTLRKAFKRESDLATLTAVLTAPIVSPSTLRSDIPPLLNAIVLKAMERDLNQRFATAAEVVDALNSFLANKGYVHTERTLTEYMAGLFDAERRLGKLRVAHAVPVEQGGKNKTPSQVAHLSQHLSPIRSTPTHRRTQALSAPILRASPEAEAVGAQPWVDIPPSDAESEGLQEDTAAFLLDQQRRRLRARVIAGLALVAVIAGFFVFRSKPVVVSTATKPKVEEAPRQGTPPSKNEPTPKVPAPTVVVDSTPVEPTKTPTEAPVKQVDSSPKGGVVRGKLTLDTSPWSEVFLKGKKLGDTPIVNYSLTPGIYVITLVNEQKDIRSVIEVEIEAGKTTVKKLKL